MDDDFTLNIGSINKSNKSKKENSQQKKEEKFLKYKEKKSMLNQKRSRPLKKVVVERNEDVFKKKEKIPKKESLRSNHNE
jgi:hypothetical protein